MLLFTIVLRFFSFSSGPHSYRFFKFGKLGLVCRIGLLVDEDVLVGGDGCVQKLIDYFDNSHV